MAELICPALAALALGPGVSADERPPGAVHRHAQPAGQARDAGEGDPRGGQRLFPAGRGGDDLVGDEGFAVGAHGGAQSACRARCGREGARQGRRRGAPGGGRFGGVGAGEGLSGFVHRQAAGGGTRT